MKTQTAMLQLTAITWHSVIFICRWILGNNTGDGHWVALCAMYAVVHSLAIKIQGQFFEMT